MKKVALLLLSAILALATFAGCSEKGTDVVAVRVYAPDGAPAIGMAKLINDNFGDADYKIVPPANIGGAVFGGDADIAIMPTNAAASLFKRGADIAMLGVTNFGSLYLIGNANDEQSLSDLAGKVVYSIGQGNVPDLVFRWLLKQAGVEYRFSTAPQEGVVNLAYVAEGTEFIGGLAAGKMNYGVISEPAATVALGKVKTASRLFDVQALYSSVAGVETGYPQAALVVKKSFYYRKPEYVRDFVQAYAASVNEKWAENNAEQALNAIKSKGSTTVATLSADIVRGCNVSFVSSADCKQQVLNFCSALESVKEESEKPDSTSVGDGFFVTITA